MKRKDKVKHLSKDKTLLIIIEQFGEIDEPVITKDLFVDIVSSIVSQQLSTKAADTIWKRFELLFPKKSITPKKLLEIPEENIRAAGISYSKIKYMKGLAQLVVDKQLDLERVMTLADEEVIEELTKVKGIGRWTAEMILMFSLAREDVFSLGDLGLRNAVAKHYNVDRDDLETVKQISDQWAPYRTLAARYLWRSLDNKPVSASQTEQ